MSNAQAAGDLQPEPARPPEPTRPPKPNDRKPGPSVFSEPDFEVQDLQGLGQQELLELAAAEASEAEGTSRDAERQALQGLSRRELVARTLEQRGRRGRLGRIRGVLQVRPEGFGFLRAACHHYRNGPDDIYVSPSQVRRLRLREGDEVSGPCRPPHGDEGYLALLRVDRVNGRPLRELFQRVPFPDLTPVLPSTRLRFAHAGCDPFPRLLDLLAPMALGHRALVLVPPTFSAVDLLADAALGLTTNHRDATVLLLQIGGSPEENAELARRLAGQDRCEVVATTFDEPPAMQTAVSRLVLARAQRLVETGRHVVLLVDSLTRLARASNLEVPHSGKIIGPDLDAAALLPPKVLFGSARSVEEGGSLTVLATLVQGGSRTDDVIAGELRHQANAEVVLHPQLCEAHGHVGLDVHETRTRRESSPLDVSRQQQLLRLRGSLAGKDAGEGLTELLSKLRETKDNDELLGLA